MKFEHSKLSTRIKVRKFCVRFLRSSRNNHNNHQIYKNGSCNKGDEVQVKTKTKIQSKLILTLLCLILGGSNKMHQGGSYQLYLGHSLLIIILIIILFLFQNLQFDPLPHLSSYNQAHKSMHVQHALKANILMSRKQFGIYHKKFLDMYISSLRKVTPLERFFL